MIDASGSASPVAPPAARGVPLPEVPGVEVEHRTVRARGLRFHVALAGPHDAQPLVLLHGWPQHWFEWRKVLPELAQHRRCVMPDLRGLGWSDAPRSGYLKEDLAHDVLSVLDELGADSADLIAHDWGGWIGFLIALRHPQRLRRYLALNIVPPWPPWPPGQPSIRAGLRLWRFWYQVVLATPWLGEALLRRTRAVERGLRADNVHPDAFSDADAAVFRLVLQDPARARASSLIYRDWLAHEMLPVLKRRYESLLPLQVPTRLLFGVRDRALGPTVPDAAIARAGGNLSVELVHDSGHFIAEERPDLVVARAREFLRI